jgi:AcrR family transcriptional regulator
MPRNNEIEKDILNEASKLFFDKGYKKVTVDQLASNLSISKKTIYKYFESKQDLLEKTFDNWSSKITIEINEILDQRDLSFIEKLKSMMSHIGVSMGKMNSDLIIDIQENVPHLWVKINKYKHEAAFLRFKKLIDEGITKGKIKKNINRNLVVALYACAIETLLDPNFLNTLPPDMKKKLPKYHSDIFDQTLKIIYEGILTDDALDSFSNSK